MEVKLNNYYVIYDNLNCIMIKDYHIKGIIQTGLNIFQSENEKDVDDFIKTNNLYYYKEDIDDYGN